MDLIGDDPILKLSNKEMRIYSKNKARFPQYIGAKSKVKNSMISEGTRIYGTVENSIISGGVVVEEGAIVKDSVIMEDVIIRKGAKVYTAIVDAECEILANATVGTEGAGKDGITVIASGSTVLPEKN